MMDMALDQTGDIPDEALLVLFANGDSVAARALTLRLTPRILAHAYRMTGNRAEAEDIAQDAMLRLWKIAPEWRQGEAKVTTWLYRVVANLSTDRLRRARTASLDAADDPQDDRPSALEEMQDKARADALQQALCELPNRQREAVVLRHIEGLANPEIAEIMQISIEAVESLIARGKRALATGLKDRQDELGYTQ